MQVPGIRLTFPLCDFDRQLLGPWLFGVGLDLLLFGILTVQTYVYYLAFPKDRKLLKLAVIWVYLVGMAQTILAVVDLNSAHSAQCTELGSTSHFWLTVVASSAVVALIAQWLYAYRIYVISHKRWILIFIVCLSLGQLGSSFIGCICLGNDSTLYAIDLGFHGFGVAGGVVLCSAGFKWVWGPLNILCDTTITLSMSILLLKRRRGVLKTTTHAHVTRVVQIVVETGLATSIMVVLYAVTYNSVLAPSYTSVSVWTIPGLALGKVYSNSMLALLNSRLTIVGGRNAGDPIGISEIRSEVLRSEVGREDRAAASTITRRTTPNEGGFWTRLNFIF